MTIALISLVFAGTKDQVKTLAFNKYSDAMRVAGEAFKRYESGTETTRIVTDDFNTAVIFSRESLLAVSVSDFGNELRVNGILEIERNNFTLDLQRKLDASAPKVISPGGRGFPRVEV